MFSGASNFVETVDAAFLFIVIISVVILFGVTFLMIYFVIKYSRKRNPKAVNYHGNIKLEIAWTVIPTILVLGMFWFGWTGYKQMTNVPPDAMVVDVTAQMWKWSFKYENGATSDSLFVPLNKAVRLNLHSLDVNHSFFIPAFRVKKDVIPNRNNFLWFIPLELGDYDIACTEYCGLNHWDMYTKVVVIPEADFIAWLNANAPSDEQENGAGEDMESETVQMQDSEAQEEENQTEPPVEDQ
jgi:cytochrome c oxidase subunit II